ncbi:hypothetical protein [Alkalihalobacillus sp. 1P02AB]|uniref:hypothetical protein n=1 Tax=Alkalihalobacillus sp. 1P02AB TaxID=3132260 RepID=UPI0039A66C6D
MIKKLSGQEKFILLCGVITFAFMSFTLLLPNDKDSFDTIVYEEDANEIELVISKFEFEERMDQDNQLTFNNKKVEASENVNR